MLCLFEGVPCTFSVWGTLFAKMLNLPLCFNSKRILSAFGIVYHMTAKSRLKRKRQRKNPTTFASSGVKRNVLRIMKNICRCKDKKKEIKNRK